MKYTPNYGLKKPEQDDFYNVEDFNENADIIDEKLKEIEDGIENIEVPVTSVNEKTGDVVLTAEDVGAETPTGAQAKAEAAAGAVQAELDAHKAEHLRIEIGVAPPENINSKTFWLEYLGESIDFVLGGGLLIGNASIDGSDDVWFDENV